MRFRFCFRCSKGNYIGVKCGIMDQFASVFGKEGSLMRLDCRSLEYQYFPFKPEGYRLVLVDSVVKHELASSAYNKRRQSCENVVAAIAKKHEGVQFLRDCSLEMLAEVKEEVSAEDYMRAEYVIEEIQRVLDVCDALEKGDYETVGQKMYETHHGMSKKYEVSCEEDADTSALLLTVFTSALTGGTYFVSDSSSRRASVRTQIASGPGACS